MADLMNDSYTYSDLANQYGNFHVPAFKVKIDGRDVAVSHGLVIGNVRTSLSMDSASSLSFTVSDVYDLKNRTIKQGVKDLFQLGKKIELELGYLSKTTLVFKGFIASHTYGFQTVPEIKVNALDVRRLMMLSDNKQKYHSVQNYSDLVSEIMNDYSGFCSLQVDRTNDGLKEPVVQKTNDYQYITNELIKYGKAEREFFVLADVAYFRIPKKNKNEVITLDYGESLFSFSRTVSYMSMEIEVAGKDLSSKVTVKSQDGIKDLSGNPQKTTVVDVRENGQDYVETRANALAERKKDKSRTANGSCIGLPEIVPGRYIQLKNLDQDLDGKYYIVSVEHSLGGDGFQTSFEIMGWL